MSKYIFKQDKYYPNGLHLGVHFGFTEQRYKVNFSKECLYSLLNWENDWNKLCGWSYGLLPVRHKEGYSSSPDFRLFGVDYVWAHHYNSIRICWRAKEDKIELCIYTYEKGIRKTIDATHLDGKMLLDVDKDINLTLNHFSANGIIMLSNLSKEFGDNSVLSLYSTLDVKPCLGYRLFPVFGGNDRTPHQMSINLERL
jgi:hypothetical protein